jgi:peptide/nickel transport system substrate-binding protein
LFLNRKAITKTQGVIVLVIIVVAAFGVYYMARPSAPPTTTTQTTLTPAPTTTVVAKPSKVFTAAETYDFVTDIDPAYSFSGEIIAMANVYEGLLVYTGGTPEVKPALATSYEVSPDGLTWTFKLREGVKFHDGTPFNATAVKYCFDRIRELGAGAVYIWDPVKELKIIDTYTVQYTLSYAAPLQRIASSVYGSWIYSPNVNKTGDIKDLHDWFNAGHDAGTGPYMIESLERGVQLTLTYFEDYWGGWGGPHAADQIAKVVFKIVEDPAVRVQMIESGSVQYAADVPTQERKRLQNETGIQVVWEQEYFSHYAFMNTQSPYLKNKLIRQALSYAFPYQDFIATGEGALVQPHGAIPTGMWGHFDDLYQYQLNLTKAKELLVKAGYPNGGFKLTYYYISGVITTETAGELWKAELSKLGIDLEIRAMTWPSLWELIKQGPGKYNYDICAWAWWPTYITPYDFLYNMWHTETTPLWNAAYYYNPEFDKLIDQASTLEGPQPNEALKLYKQAQQILIEDAPAVFLDDLRLPFVMRSNVEGFQYNPAFGYDTFLFWEMWVEGT